MAGTGKAFTFHGSYTSKILAARKEREIPGAFIVIRDGRYYVLKPKKIRTKNPRRKTDCLSYTRGRKTRRKTNPPRGMVLIYRNITRIEGTKGKGSKYPGQRFYHNFKRPGPAMYGLPDGTLVIKKG
jgi:hypothetical protein